MHQPYELEGQVVDQLALRGGAPEAEVALSVFLADHEYTTVVRMSCSCLLLLVLMEGRPLDFHNDDAGRWLYGCYTSHTLPFCQGRLIGPAAVLRCSV